MPTVSLNPRPRTLTVCPKAASPDVGVTVSFCPLRPVAPARGTIARAVTAFAPTLLDTTLLDTAVLPTNPVDEPVAEVAACAGDVRTTTASGAARIMEARRIRRR